jgi:hypothetical protein
MGVSRITPPSPGSPLIEAIGAWISIGSTDLVQQGQGPCRQVNGLFLLLPKRPRANYSMRVQFFFIALYRPIQKFGAPQNYGPCAAARAALPWARPCRALVPLASCPLLRPCTSYSYSPLPRSAPLRSAYSGSHSLHFPQIFSHGSPCRRPTCTGSGCRPPCRPPRPLPPPRRRCNPPSGATPLHPTPAAPTSGADHPGLAAHRGAGPSRR